jgi:hypothetical protein
VVKRVVRTVWNVLEASLLHHGAILLRQPDSLKTEMVNMANLRPNTLVEMFAIIDHVPLQTSFNLKTTLNTCGKTSGENGLERSRSQFITS